MRKKLIIYTCVGFLFVSVTGTLLHFTYEWSGRNYFAALIAPVNESTWEHLKMLFFPMLFYGALEACRLKQSFPGCFGASAAGILLGVLLLVCIFYTYSGVLGTNYLFADILTFLISVAGAFCLRLWLMERQVFAGTDCGASVRPLVLFFLKSAVFLLFLCFVLFTFFPPSIGLFISP